MTVELPSEIELVRKNHGKRNNNRRRSYNRKEESSSNKRRGFEESFDRLQCEKVVRENDKKQSIITIALFVMKKPKGYKLYEETFLG